MNIDDAFRTGYETGKKETLEKVLEIISLTDKANADTIKTNPELASYLLLELTEKVQALLEKS